MAQSSFARSPLARVAVLAPVVTAILAPLAITEVVAQRPMAVGPWSGQAQCVVVAKWADYLDEQTHTWRLTGEAPSPPPPGSAQVYYTWPATWSVQGSGRKAFPSREPAIGREQTERWTIASAMKISLRITDLGTGRLRIGAEGQRGAPLGSIRVTEVSGRIREASVQPWPFPPIEDIVASTTISGTNARTYPEGFGVGWGQPPKAITTATCSWSFTTGGVEQSGANSPTGQRGVGGRNVLAGGGATGSLATTPAASPTTSIPAAATAGSTSNAVPADGQLAIVPGTVVPQADDSCKLPVAIPSDSVRVTPGSVYFKVTGIPIYCDGCPSGFASGNAGAALAAVHHGANYVINRSDRPDPIVVWHADKDFIDMRMSMEYGRTYTFAVYAETAVWGGVGTGSGPGVQGCGRTQVSVTPPVPATPNITATTVTGNTVTIRWGLVSQSESGYLAIGPGRPAQGTETADAFVRTGPLSAGTHRWVIMPFWDTPEGRVIDESRGARVTATIP
jgi:hypothetical protein